MNESITNQQGGTAAETTITNSNPTPVGNSQPCAKSEAHVTLKHAAAEFYCAVSSLKNNIKTDKLPATQENPKAAYIVSLSDVERFLRATPGIVSIFHPKSGVVRGEMSDVPPLADVEQPSQDAADVPPDNVVSHFASPDASAPQGGSPLSTQPPKPQAVGPVPPVNAGKRRRRRRGKGGVGAQLGTTGTQSLLLGNLVGASPQERLRVVAVLNELAGIIASA